MMTALVQTFNQEMARVVEQVHHSLVQVQNGRRGHGAGTIWREDGLIITNAHVTQRHSPQITLWDGRTYAATLLAYDERLDLAALAIEAAGLPTLPLQDTASLQAGTWVLAAGHPWGVKGAVSAGAVIDVGVPLELRRYPGELIQMSLQLRPGHSGGPLVDGSGRLLGINTMIAGPQVGLAIPVTTINTFLAQNLVPKASAPDEDQPLYL